MVVLALAPEDATRDRGGPMEILVENGVYTPARIEVPAETRDTGFLRKESEPVRRKGFIHHAGVSAELPLDKPVTLTLTLDKPGEYEFTCQMRMYRGTLVALRCF